jgi:hypothetical protein
LIAEVRERLSVDKLALQYGDIFVQLAGFKGKKRSDVNRLSVLENVNDNVDINRAWTPLDRIKI